jgi:two-component system, NarL family, invasion response regulator UvrY
MNEKNIVLVDDHIIVRNGLKELIEKLGPYKITGQADSGDQLLQMLTAGPLPDLIVMDLEMPGMPVADVISAIRDNFSAVPVLALSFEAREEAIIRLFRKGIRGFLRKDCTADDLKSSFENIFRFGYHHNEYLALSLNNDAAEPPKDKRREILDRLTVREREFLKLVCHEKEYTYEQIADQMSVTPRTVDGYRESIFEKLAVRSKTGLVLFVLRHDLMKALV